MSSWPPTTAASAAGRPGTTPTTGRPAESTATAGPADRAASAKAAGLLEILLPRESPVAHLLFPIEILLDAGIVTNRLP